jgi:hypothetical protein
MNRESEKRTWLSIISEDAATGRGRCFNAAAVAHQPSRPPCRLGPPPRGEGYGDREYDDRRRTGRRECCRSVRRREGRAARGELTGPPQPWNELAAIADHLSAPQVIFTQPEVAVVGLTEAAAVISPMGEIVTEAHLRPGSRATFSAHRFPGRPNGRPSGEATGRWDVHRYG